DTVQNETAISTISQEYLLEFTSEYGISEDLHLELPGPKERIVDIPEGKVGVNTKFFEFANFRLPLLQFLFDILGHYQIHLSQLNGRFGRDNRPSGLPSTKERSPLDFANENPSQQSTRGDETEDQGQETVAPEIPPPENVTTTGVAPEAGLVEEIAAMGPRVTKERRKKGNDGVDANVQPKVLRKDHADSRPTQSTVGGKSLASMRLGTGSTFLVPTLQETPADVSDPDPLSFVNPQSIPKENVAYTTSDNGFAPTVELVNELENLRALFANIQGSNDRLSQQVSTLHAQVTGEEKLKAAFEEFKKYKDDWVEKSCRRWVIGHGLRLAVMKYGESAELRQVFADVVSAGIAKEADTKYVAALHALRYLKYPMVDQLVSLKDASIDVIMASLHLESDSREEAPQWIRELRPGSSQLNILVYPEVHDPKDP
nr:transposase (putative), gypsy type [Tanacetum cinerariifolium]